MYQNRNRAIDMKKQTSLETYSGEENGNPLQYSCLGNPMDRKVWWARVHGVAKSQIGLSMHTHTHTHTQRRGGG